MKQKIMCWTRCSHDSSMSIHVKLKEIVTNWSVINTGTSLDIFLFTGSIVHVLAKEPEILDMKYQCDDVNVNPRPG